MSNLPHKVIEEAIYKYPGDWAGQLGYVTAIANEIIKEQSETIDRQNDELFELKRNKVFLKHANQSLAYA